MTRMFWAICAITFVAFAISVAFPRLRIGGAGETSHDGVGVFDEGAAP